MSTLWLIGVLFTLGYIDDGKTGTLGKEIVSFLQVLIFWPVILGLEVMTYEPRLYTPNAP
jgi:hypothetical protein